VEVVENVNLFAAPREKLVDAADTNNRFGGHENSLKSVEQTRQLQRLALACSGCHALGAGSTAPDGQPSNGPVSFAPQTPPFLLTETPPLLPRLQDPEAAPG